MVENLYYQYYTLLLIMLVTIAGLRNLRLIPAIAHNFAKKKGKKDDGEDDGQIKNARRPQQIKEQTQIDDKLINKSAALYDHYVKSRERSMLTLDNYQIRFVYVIERAPIFLPYDAKRFDYYRTKYQYLKKTGYYPEIPKQLQVETGDFLFTQYERQNPENLITHRNTVSKTEVYEYSQNSRYWKYTDPTITDPHSVQAYSSDGVYFITKDKQGKWQFPTRLLSEKDNHKEIFTVIASELFGGGPSPIVYFSTHKPMYARKIEDETLTRGKGYYDYYFKGFSVNGIPKFPTQKYDDFAWVPKPLLAKYFQDDYFKDNIKLAIHMC